MIKFLRYPDLVERGIVRNRPTLSRWIKHHGFPAGILIGPNSRAWLEAEIDEWVAERKRASTVVKIILLVVICALPFMRMAA